MKHLAPPAWMEKLLQILLPAKDRETVTGDLYEEFCETRAARLGKTGANLWYLRQVASFAPGRLRSLASHPRGLALVCAFTAAVGIWFTVMDLRLHHPATELGIGVFIFCQSLLTLAALRFGVYRPVRYVAMLGCAGLLWLAGRVLVGIVRGNDIEGYILIMAAAILVQAILTFGTLAAAKRPA